MSLDELEMPHSPLFAGHSPFFEPHSLLFAPFALGGMGRDELFAPLDVELAALSLPFARHEEWGMRFEEEGMRLEGQGTRREEVFE